jgi:NAD(P)H-hydrate epimerase
VSALLASQYLSQRDAARLDEVLMGPEVGFSVDQLMELAGFSVAQCVHKLFPPAANRSVLVVCGPGSAPRCVAPRPSSSHSLGRRP